MMYKYLLAWMLLVVSSLPFLSFAADPSFGIVPASGTTLKMHCNYSMNLWLYAGGQKYNGFQSTVKYVPADAQITHTSVNAPFSEYTVGALEGADRYRVGGNTPTGVSGTVNVAAATFGFKTLTNTTSTTLSFVDIVGNPIAFGQVVLDGSGNNTATADGEWVLGVAYGGADILSGTADATYNFVPWPCVMDTAAPQDPSVLGTLVPANGTTNIAYNQVGSFLIRDWAGSNGHYWYNGDTSKNISNYVAVPSTVDNQDGVNSGSIKVKVSCATCTPTWSVTYSGSDLTITPWTGNGAINQWTWNSNDRGYVVNFPAPGGLGYEVEKTIALQIVAADNPNESGLTYTFTGNYAFNAPQIPTISRLVPNVSTFVSPAKTNALQFFFQDDWAGIDTGTIKITIPAIYSGAQLLMTGRTYSGSDFASIALSGGNYGLGSGGDYVVTFFPKWDLYPNTGIVITGMVSDLAGSAANAFSTSFVTRPDCGYFGCHEVLNVNILGGTHAASYDFSGAYLLLTGTNPNSPYPYLTGVNNDIVICGFPWNGSLLTGNVPLYNTSSVDQRGTTYTNTKLYITGLNFTVQNGVIVVQ